jgi:hypothetical protein
MMRKKGLQNKLTRLFLARDFQPDLFAGKKGYVSGATYCALKWSHALPENITLG